MRSAALFPIGTIIAVLAVACGEESADVASPNDYSKDGVTFQYPGNWNVSEDGKDGSVRFVTIETPGDAIAIVTVAPSAEAAGLMDYARVFSAAAEKEIPIGSVEGASFGEIRTEGGYEVVTERLAIVLAGERVPHTRTFRRRAFDGRTCFLVFQVSDEDLDDVSPGFDQIATSLHAAASR